MNESRKWNGARWWKFDFHTHTPASDDYGKGPDQAVLKARAPRDWLLDYMQAGIDCIAITDHNTGAWIDALKGALAELDREQPEGYRPLVLFPGVELSVHGGVHVLAIFGSGKGTPDIDALLGAVGYQGNRGYSDGVTHGSFVEVIAEIHAAGGIAIPAHADSPSGLFEMQGTTLQQALDCPDIFAMEVLDSAKAKPHAYIATKLAWTVVLGSDAHHPAGKPGARFPGSHYTWVKMGLPAIEGLRLALLDGDLSVLRSDAGGGDPNAHPDSMIESIHVEEARYMGRGQAFEVPLNPWLNAVIGGRGTGKSTLVEFQRLVFRRERELPEGLRGDFEKYTQVTRSRSDGGLLTADTKLRVVYRKNDARYRLQWSADASLEAVEEWNGEHWNPGEGDIRQRFPVRIYSQKQIFHLARDPLALIEVINEAPGVEYAEWKRRFDAKGSQYLALRAKIREIETGLQEEPRIKGELADVQRKLALFEQTGHSEILKALQKRRRQANALADWESGLDAAALLLRDTASKLIPDDLDETHFDSGSPEDAALLEQARLAKTEAETIASEVAAIAERAEGMASAWRERKSASLWQAASSRANQQYQELQERLNTEGVTDLSEFGALVQRRQFLEQQTTSLVNRKLEVSQLKAQAGATLEEFAKIRQEITRSRQTFLQSVLSGNPYVRIAVLPFGARETVEEEFRGLLRREGGGFDKDIGAPDGEGLLGALYRSDDMPGGLTNLKQEIRKIAREPQQTQVADRRFASHLGNLPPETFDRLDLWFPEDSLAVEYSPSKDSASFRPIHEGSPGQKTAALLAFLLSYGNEPLILDQPEDDLDNHLIYDLIVTQLREAKRRRQVIVVTHNANIVVNGDAELVIALVARTGQTQMEAGGCLQERDVRATICTVMEGGKKAFEQRYRRIALGGRHVR